MKDVVWLGGSLKDLKAMPVEVRSRFAYGLLLAQRGDTHPDAKMLHRTEGGIYELIEDFRSDTYRAVYTVRYADRVYVLHCFQKKSVKGISTPKPAIRMIEARLVQARRHAEGR